FTAGSVRDSVFGFRCSMSVRVRSGASVGGEIMLGNSAQQESPKQAAEGRGAPITALQLHPGRRIPGRRETCETNHAEAGQSPRSRSVRQLEFRFHVSR